jgi:hypothetical protein
MKSPIQFSAEACAPSLLSSQASMRRSADEHVPEGPDPGWRDQLVAPTGVWHQSPCRCGHLVQHHQPWPTLPLLHRVASNKNRQWDCGRTTTARRSVHGRAAAASLFSSYSDVESNFVLWLVGAMTHSLVQPPGGGVRAARGHLWQTAELLKDHHEEWRHRDKSYGKLQGPIGAPIHQQQAPCRKLVCSCFMRS